MSAPFAIACVLSLVAVVAITRARAGPTEEPLIVTPGQLEEVFQAGRQSMKNELDSNGCQRGLTAVLGIRG